MSQILSNATPLERRIARRLEARGDDGLAEALLGLNGVEFAGRYRFESLYAVGGEGAVYTCRDLDDPTAPLRVAKVAVLPHHRPFDLNENEIRKRRYNLRVEAQYLANCGSRFMPKNYGMYEFQNPLLDPERGDAFAELEPVMVMEKLPGRDLDLWLARMHSSAMPQDVMRRTLDRITVVLLQALVELHESGFHYADLRPGNLRMMGRPERRIRLLDAGSLVAVHDRSGRFPHVPAYLSPSAFELTQKGEPVLPAPELLVEMAGRTLYEVATGRVPMPGQQVELEMLKDSNVSPPVADVIDGMCRGDFVEVRVALRYLAKRAKRRVAGGNDPKKINQVGSVNPHTRPPDGSDELVVSPRELEKFAAQKSAAAPQAPPEQEPLFAAAVAPSEPLPRADRDDPILPPSTKPAKKGLFARLFGWLK